MLPEPRLLLLEPGAFSSERQKPSFSKRHRRQPNEMAADVATAAAVGLPFHYSYGADTWRNETHPGGYYYYYALVVAAVAVVVVAVAASCFFDRAFFSFISRWRDY